MTERFRLIEEGVILSNEEKCINIEFGYIIQDLYNKGLMSLYSYFEDQKCAFMMIELKEYYLIEMYSLNGLRYSMFINHMIDEEFISENDPLHIYDILIKYNSNYMPFLKINTKSLDFVSISPYIQRLLFKKDKFSKSECEYWAHISLKNYVNFIKKLNVLVQAYPTSFTSKDKESFKKHLKKEFKALDLNSISFMLEANIEYKNKKDDILNELRMDYNYGFN